MLDIDFVELRRGFLQYLPIGGVIGLVMLVELLAVLTGWVLTPEATKHAVAPMPAPETVTNTHALGELIYTHYFYLFQVAGLVLLVAMIGAIVLTHRKREGVYHQNIADQIARRPEESIVMHKIEPGRGI
ncbi:MAG: NADH-quinone oxidoreductase subunit J, partial [Rhodospirillales bacterium]|nr:NADH-quinone oxidoreductase subunit J [Rhodospirillales bacterium]